MLFRIIKHYSKENGAFLGYELQHKPFVLWPFWRSFQTAWYTDLSRLEHDIVFALSLDGIVKNKKAYN